MSRRSKPANPPAPATTNGAKAPPNLGQASGLTFGRRKAWISVKSPMGFIGQVSISRADLRKLVIVAVERGL